MANQKEKIFILNYETSEPGKLHDFIDKNCASSKTDKKKYLHWSRFLPNFYTLATMEDTYWDVNNLTKAIFNHMEKNILFVLFEVQNAPAQGRMKTDFWDHWKKSQDLTGYVKNQERARKLKKLMSYTKRKAELERKEKALQRRKVELEKSISLKKREDEIKAKEKELEELEKQLAGEPEVEETPKKRRRWRR